MKIENIEPKEKFIPIVITLETEEDASLLWHLANCAVATTMATYSEDKKISVDAIGNLKDNLWGRINNLYRPKGK